MVPMRIERLGPQDWQALRGVRLAALADSPQAFWATLSDERRFDRGRWSSFLTSVAWFVARRTDGSTAGVAGLMQPSGSDAEVIGMWVDPVERGRGMGARLTRTVLDEATRIGATSVSLWVTDGNDAAYRMYERLGFALTGESAVLPYDAATGERRMRITLPHGQC